MTGSYFTNIIMIE